MELLISKSEVEKYFQIAIGRKESEFNNFIREAQQFELKKIMPRQLYYDVVANPTQYDELLNEHSYECEGKPQLHSGLKAVLAQFTYAIYLLKGNMQDTSYGVVVKQNNFSDPADYKERKDWHTRHIQQGNELYEEVEKYIECKGLVKGDKCSIKTNRTFKTSVVK